MEDADNLHEETVGLLCRNCFHDPGLRLMASGETGIIGDCPSCGLPDSHLIPADALKNLSYEFFVRGSQHRPQYGGAPRIQFNDKREGSLHLGGPLQHDIELLERTLDIGFFEYFPRLWMIGEIEPLKDLQDRTSRPRIIDRILREFPVRTLEPRDEFYRIRKSPASASDVSEYDSPPAALLGNGRLENPALPVLYASQDLEVCVHECRFAAGDELYAASLKARNPLKLLDLSAILEEEETEFESLDLAVNMIFLAGSHSYEISRDISEASRSAGFDGLIYPSFFSLLRTGGRPIETVYGLSIRRFGDKEYERSKIIPNIALFGRPIAERKVDVLGINRVEITAARYGISLGPVL